MRRKLIVSSVALLAAAVVFPVMAKPSVTMTAKTTNANLVGSCTNGSQIWEVAFDLTVQNGSAETATFDTAGFFAKFAQPGNPGQTQNNITVVNDGGFAPGASVASGQTGHFSPVVQLSLPCDTADASIFAQGTLAGNTKVYEAGDPFLQSGTPVPVGATGIFGIALAVAVIGLIGQRLSRRPRAAKVSV